MKYLLFLSLLVMFSCKTHHNWDCNGNCENGFGIKQWQDGGYLKGHWKNGKIYGDGSEFFGSTSKFAGDTYIGHFDNGYSGYGTYYDKSEDATHIGQWKDGKPNGYGKSTFGDKAKSPNMYYDGAWKNGLYDGFGKFYLGDSGPYAKDRYIGNFSKGEFSGAGTYYWANGNNYEGNFTNDEMDGEGTYTFKDGFKYHGLWKNGANPELEKLRGDH